MGCSNKGELVSLYAQGLITAVEVNWLKSNLLSQTECNRAAQIEATVQTNLFDQDRHEELQQDLPLRPSANGANAPASQSDFEPIGSVASLLKAQTTQEVRRTGWGKKQGIAYIKERYGVSDRSSMSIEQLTEFRDHLRSLPDK